MAAAAAVAVGGTASAYALRPDGPHPLAAGQHSRPTHIPSWRQSSAPTATARPTPASAEVSAAPSASASTPATAPAAAGAVPVYGSNVDTADAVPANKDLQPAALPKRPEGQLTAADGKYQGPQKGFIGGEYVMMHRDDNVTLTCKGYIRVRYEIAWFNRPGAMVMPTWTGLQGKLFHVGSGGGYRMDDPQGSDPAYTWMGAPVPGPNGPASGYVVLPSGAQQMWQNEFFYLDGTVTLTNHERGADYNITATPMDWAAVSANINYKYIRYGIVRDTGDDAAPVPQYTTRTVTPDPAAVPQKSAV